MRVTVTDGSSAGVYGGTGPELTGVLSSVLQLHHHLYCVSMTVILKMNTRGRQRKARTLLTSPSPFLLSLSHTRALSPTLPLFDHKQVLLPLPFLLLVFLFALSRAKQYSRAFPPSVRWRAEVRPLVGGTFPEASRKVRFSVRHVSLPLLVLSLARELGRVGPRVLVPVRVDTPGRLFRRVSDASLRRARLGCLRDRCGPQMRVFRFLPGLLRSRPKLCVFPIFPWRLRGPPEMCVFRFFPGRRVSGLH